jgi:hypothetical protein
MVHTLAEDPSSTLGSDGGGPSIAQRLDSYLERIKDSILLIRRKPGSLSLA